MQNQEGKIKNGAMKNGKSRMENQERSNEEWKIKRGAMNNGKSR
jgi:hypothetical protein